MTLPEGGNVQILNTFEDPAYAGQASSGSLIMQGRVVEQDDSGMRAVGDEIILAPADSTFAKTLLTSPFGKGGPEGDLQPATLLIRTSKDGVTAQFLDANRAPVGAQQVLPAGTLDQAFAGLQEQGAVDKKAFSVFAPLRNAIAKRNELKNSLADAKAELKQDKQVLAEVQGLEEKLAVHTEVMGELFKQLGFTGESVALAEDALHSGSLAHELESRIAGLEAKVLDLDAALVAGNLKMADSLATDIQGKQSRLAERQQAILGSLQSKEAGVRQLLKEAAGLLKGTKAKPEDVIKTLGLMHNLLKNDKLTPMLYLPLKQQLIMKLEGPAKDMAVAMLQNDMADVNQAYASVKADAAQMADGAAKGDFIDEPTVWNIVGQVLTGFTPVGIAADGRDILANGKKVIASQGEQAKLGLAFSVLALCPVGDAVKGGWKLAQKGLGRLSEIPGVKKAGEFVEKDFKQLTKQGDAVLGKLRAKAGAEGLESRYQKALQKRALAQGLKQAEIVVGGKQAGAYLSKNPEAINSLGKKGLDNLTGLAKAEKKAAQADYSALSKKEKTYKKLEDKLAKQETKADKVLKEGQAKQARLESKKARIDGLIESYRKGDISADEYITQMDREIPGVLAGSKVQKGAQGLGDSEKAAGEGSRVLRGMGEEVGEKHSLHGPETGGTQKTGPGSEDFRERISGTYQESRSRRIASQKAEIASQKAEIASQKAEIASQKARRASVELNDQIRQVGSKNELLEARRSGLRDAKEAAGERARAAGEGARAAGERVEKLSDQITYMQKRSKTVGDGVVDESIAAQVTTRLESSDISIHDTLVKWEAELQAKGYKGLDAYAPHANNLTQAGNWIEAGGKTKEHMIRVTAKREVAESISEGIRRAFLKSENRFGDAVYVAQNSKTGMLELAAHGNLGKHMNKFEIDMTKVKALDLRDPAVAKRFNYHPKDSYAKTAEVAHKARVSGYNAIIYDSVRNPGSMNIAVIDDFDTVMKSTDVKRVPENLIRSTKPHVEVNGSHADKKSLVKAAAVTLATGALVGGSVKASAQIAGVQVQPDNQTGQAKAIHELPAASRTLATQDPAAQPAQARAVDKILNPDLGHYQADPGEARRMPGGLDQVKPGDTYTAPNGVQIEIKERIKTPDGGEQIRGEVLPKSGKKPDTNQPAKATAAGLVAGAVLNNTTVKATGEKLSAVMGNQTAQASVLLQDAQQEERKLGHLGDNVAAIAGTYQQAEATLAKTSPVLYTAMVKAAALMDEKAVQALFVPGTSLDLLRVVANGLVKEIASIKFGVEKGETWAASRLGELKARLGQLRQEVDNYIKAHVWEGIGPVGKLALAVTWGSEKLHANAAETGGWAGIGLKLIAQFNPGNLIMGSWGSLTGGEKVTAGRVAASVGSVAVGSVGTGFTYLNPSLIGIQTGLILSQEVVYTRCVKMGMGEKKAAWIKDAIGSIGFLMVMASWKSEPVRAAKAAGGCLAGIKALGQDMLTKNYAVRLGVFVGIEQAASRTAWLINASLGGDKYTGNVIKGSLIGIGLKYGAKPAQKLVQNWIKRNEVAQSVLQEQKAKGDNSPAGMGTAKPRLDQGAVNRALLNEIAGAKGTVAGGIKNTTRNKQIIEEYGTERKEYGTERKEYGTERKEYGTERKAVEARKREVTGQLQQPAEAIRRAGSESTSLDRRIAGLSAQNEVLSLFDQALGYMANLQKGFKPEYQKNQPESIRPKIDDSTITGATRPGLISATLSALSTPWRTGLAGATGVGLVLGIGNQARAALPAEQIETSFPKALDPLAQTTTQTHSISINPLGAKPQQANQLKSEIKQGVVAQTAQAVKDSSAYLTSGIKTQAYAIAHTLVPNLATYQGNLQEMKNAYTQAQGLTKLQIAGGIVASHLSGDLGDVQKPITYDATGPAILYINGMKTDKATSDKTADLIVRKSGVNTIGQVSNNTHTLGLGDAAQVLGHEAGMVDITSIRAAHAMRQGILEKGEVYVIAHSQGTAISHSALKLLTPEERQHVHYQGYGGQTYIDAKETGIAEAINVRHERDGVPYIGNDIKDLAAISPSLTLSPFNFRYNAILRREDNRDWKIIREESIRGLDLNQFWNIGRHHDVDTKYLNYIVKQWEAK